MSSQAFRDASASDTFLPSSSKVNNELHTPISNRSFLVDLADVHSMKQNLQELLVSFRTGKLTAFGDKNAVERMESIRNMQGKIAHRHFELDAKVNYKAVEDSDVDRSLHDNNMTTLMGNLEGLGSVIKGLNNADADRKK